MSKYIEKTDMSTDRFATFKIREAYKEKLSSSLEEANIQNKHENSKLKRKIAEINSERSKIISVIKFGGRRG